MNFLFVALIGHIVVVDELDELVGIDVEIGGESLVAVVHLLDGIAALDGDGDLLGFVIGYFRGLGDQTDQLALAEIGGDVFQTGVGDAQQIDLAHVLQLGHDLLEHLALALGSSEVGVDFSDSRVVERFRAVHVIGALALAESGEKSVFLVTAHVTGFGSGHGDFNAALAVELADLVDDRFERLEIDDDVLVDVDT